MSAKWGRQARTFPSDSVFNAAPGILHAALYFAVLHNFLDTGLSGA